MSKETFSKEIKNGARWERKVSVPISMPQSLLREVDAARGDIARSLFVCKILRAHVDVKQTGGGARAYGNN